MQLFSRQIRVLALVAGLALLASGCGTMPVPPMDASVADVHGQHLKWNDLVIGVQPITDKAGLKKNFDMNLLDKGIVPIMMVADNRSTSKSFIIARNNLYVEDETTGATNSYRRGQVASQSTGTAVAITGGILEIGAVVPGAIMIAIGSKLASDASVAQFGFADKEFYSRTLDPGERATGFVYFQFPKSSPPSGKYNVVARIIDADTGTTVPFKFPVNLDFSH